MKVLQDNEAVEMVDGDWIMIPGNTMYQRCCDCGLIHRWEFEHTETGLMLCAVRVDDEQSRRVEAEYRSQVQTIRSG